MILKKIFILLEKAYNKKEESNENELKNLFLKKTT